MTILHLPNEEAREMLLEFVVDERDALRYQLLNEPMVKDRKEEYDDLVNRFNTLGQIFDLELWENL